MKTRQIPGKPWALYDRLDIGELHVVPVGYGCLLDSACQCEPHMTYKCEKTGIEVWSHNRPS